MKLQNQSILLLFFLFSFGISNAKRVDKKPNVLLVMTDDQGYGDLACHGNPIIKTPNIDSFYEQSIRFTNFHVGTTCTPTRGGLMTGRNCNRNGTWHTIGGCSLLNEREVTLGDIFSQNGYKTAMFGKWHLGDNYPFRPNDRGFEETFHHNGGGAGQTPDYWGNDYFDDTYFRNGIAEKTTGYCSDVWFNEAEKYIDKVGDKPFFMYLSLNAPHGPYNVPKAYGELYKDAPIQHKQKNFYGMISHLDNRFGQLLKKLEDKGIDENTIVIFMTDNGTSAGYWYVKDQNKFSGYNAEMRGTKCSQYDGGHRVPFFIKWPKGNIAGGKDITTLAAHVDILPTLVDLCDLKAKTPNELDGSSLKILLAGDENSVLEERILVTDTQRNQWPEKGRNSCVMKGDWRLVNGNELYNVSTDASQKVNIAENHSSIVNELTVFYDQWWSKIEKEFEYPIIQLGTKYENPTYLTCHDMHNKEAIPWNQNYIRQGTEFSEGYLLTQINKSGKYRISISRYPHESGLANSESIEGVKETEYTEGIAIGKALNLTSPKVVINGKSYPCSFNKDNTTAETIIDLKKEKVNLYGTFKNDNGKDVIAYYYKVERL